MLCVLPSQNTHVTNVKKNLCTAASKYQLGQKVHKLIIQSSYNICTLPLILYNLSSCRKVQHARKHWLIMLSVVILLIATGQQHIPKRERMFDWSLKICGQHIRRGCVTKTFVFTLTVFSNIDCVKTFCVYSQSVFFYFTLEQRNINFNASG